jgi:mobilization protein NikA
VSESAASTLVKRRAPWRGRPRVKEAKTHRIALRCTDEDRAFLEESASQAGLSVGAFLRTIAFGTAGARAVKRPHIEREQLARLLGEIGKLGSNVNQIAKWANTDRRAPDPRVLVMMQSDIAAMRAVVVKAFDRGD